MHAVLNVNITHSSSKTIWACAVEVSDQVKAGAAILAWGRVTLVNLCTTVLSSVASSTQTREGAMVVLHVWYRPLHKTLNYVIVHALLLIQIVLHTRRCFLMFHSLNICVRFYIHIIPLYECMDAHFVNFCHHTHAVYMQWASHSTMKC